jgi:transcriptional regulator with XRE-family HTH domain
MPLTLGRYVQQQIDAQKISVKQFAARGGLGLSHAYQILRDERQQLTPATLEGVARGLRITLPELFVALGKGTSELAPEELQVLSLYRQVPQERRPAATDMLRGLAIFPVDHPPTRRADASSKRRQAAIRQLQGNTSDHGEHDPEGALPGSYGTARLWTAICQLFPWAAVSAPSRA